MGFIKETTINRSQAKRGRLYIPPATCKSKGYQASKHQWDENSSIHQHTIIRICICMQKHQQDNDQLRMIYEDIVFNDSSNNSNLGVLQRIEIPVSTLEGWDAILPATLSILKQPHFQILHTVA